MRKDAKAPSKQLYRVLIQPHSGALWARLHLSARSFTGGSRQSTPRVNGKPETSRAATQFAFHPCCGCHAAIIRCDERFVARDKIGARGVLRRARGLAILLCAVARLRWLMKLARDAESSTRFSFARSAFARKAFVRRAVFAVQRRYRLSVRTRPFQG